HGMPARSGPSLLRLEVETHRVQTVAQTGGCRPVVEDVAEVRAAGRAMDLGAAHEQAAVFLGLDVFRRRRRPKVRPTRTRFELGVGAEELAAAAGAAVHPLVVMVPVFAGERALRPLFPKDAILLLRELLAPFLIGLHDLLRHPCAPPCTLNFPR